MEIFGLFPLLLALIAFGVVSRAAIRSADSRPPQSTEWIRAKKRKGWSEERARAEWIRRHTTTTPLLAADRPKQPIVSEADQIKLDAERYAKLVAEAAEKRLRLDLIQQANRAAVRKYVEERGNG